MINNLTNKPQTLFVDESVEKEQKNDNIETI